MATKWFHEVHVGASSPRHHMDEYILVRIEKQSVIKIMLFKVRITTRTDHKGQSDLKFHIFETVQHPRTVLQGSIYHNDAIRTDQEQYWIQRKHNSAQYNTIYATWIRRTRNYLQVPALQCRVYEYHFERAFLVLPEEFYRVNEDESLTQYYTYTGDNWSLFREPAPAVATIPAQEKKVFIPTMYFNTFVEMAVSKGEECPITMEPLSKDNVGSPPCGHLFEKEALKKALTESGKCPTCRRAALATDIQTI